MHLGEKEKFKAQVIKQLLEVCKETPIRKSQRLESKALVLQWGGGRSGIQATIKLK